VKILTPAEFSRICTLIWGDRFVPAAARDLKRCVRAIEGYKAGEANVPPKVREKLAEIAAIRSEQLQDVVSMLLR